TSPETLSPDRRLAPGLHARRHSPFLARSPSRQKSDRSVSFRDPTQNGTQRRRRSTTMTTTVDVVVIGGGPGGYSAAIRLAQRGLEVVCIERESVGGVCLNWGCIPSKALITVAERYGWVTSQSASFGVDVEGVRLDLPRAQERNREIVRHHTEGVAGLLRSNGARLVRAHARLDGPRRVRAVDGGRRGHRFEARRAVLLATGARVREVPGVRVDGRAVLTAREAVFLQEVPEHLIVLGGGVIGLELGSAYQRLGARLTVVELGPTLLPGVDPDL